MFPIKGYKPNPLILHKYRYQDKRESEYEGIFIV